MRRSTVGWLCALGLVLLLGTGCSTLPTQKWNWGWQQLTHNPEEYVDPPNEPRYNNPQSYPRALMTPKLKNPKDEFNRDMQAGQPGMGRTPGMGFGPGGSR